MLRATSLIAITLCAISAAADADSSGLPGSLFSWLPQGATCRILAGRKHDPIVFGSVAKPQIFAVGHCANPISGFEKYAATILSGYQSTDLLFTGYMANGAKYFVYFAPGTGRRTQISDYVTRYAKSPNPPASKNSTPSITHQKHPAPPVPDWQPPF